LRQFSQLFSETFAKQLEALAQAQVSYYTFCTEISL
jgi:hypothetical protein